MDGISITLSGEEGVAGFGTVAFAMVSADDNCCPESSKQGVPIAPPKMDSPMPVSDCVPSEKVEGNASTVFSAENVAVEVWGEHASHTDSVDSFSISTPEKASGIGSNSDDSRLVLGSMSFGNKISGSGYVSRCTR